MFFENLQPWRGIIILLLAIECRYCHFIFHLCRSCYRGQCYCGEPCRLIAQRKAHRLAQQRYRQTTKGRKAHCRAEQQRRFKKNRPREKNMADEGSTPAGSHVNLVIKQIKTIICCCCCGVIGQVVSKFPRRGYGQH